MTLGAKNEGIIFLMVTLANFQQMTFQKINILIHQ